MTIRCAPRARRYSTLRGTVCALLLLSACAPARRAYESPPNIVLIVIDTLRADRVGGVDGATVAPFLDELSAQYINFRNAYAPSSWTRPSVASLFTSRYPSQHRVDSFLSALDDEETTLAESLARAGYVAGGFSANPHIATLGGFAQGFRHFETFAGTKEKVRADQIAGVSLAWLDGVWNPAAPQPIFLYLHFMEPHGPYMAPEPYRERYLRPLRFLQKADPSRKVETVVNKLNRSVGHTLVRGEAEQFRKFEFDEIMMLRFLYDAEVASLDAQLRALFGELERRRFLDHAIVIITADHGEEFNEHGGMWHGRTLFNESIRVPLLIRLPGDPGARMVTDNVSLVDLMPSLLELVGAPAVPTEGHSLVPLLERQSWPARVRALWNRWFNRHDVVAELPPNSTLKVDPRVHAEAIVRDSLKAVIAPGGSVAAFDLAADPKEMRANGGAAGAADDLVATLRSMHAQWLDGSRQAQAQPTHALDADTVERLRALGYPLNTGNDAASVTGDGAPH